MNVQENNERVMEIIDQSIEMFNGMIQKVLEGKVLEDDISSHMLFQPERFTKLLTSEVEVDPAKLLEDQMQFMQQQAQLWQNATKAMMGESSQTIVSENKGDGRFRDKDWQDNPVFNYLKQAYLLNSEMLNNFVNSLKFKDPKAKEQIQFYTRQYLNTVAPTNYLLTNPEVCREIVESDGENLVSGMKNFMNDFKQSPLEGIRVAQSYPGAFVLGENIATTEGKVVFQNELIQLIHYQPTTEQVYETPLLVLPPFVNKYYILDLDEKKSMIRWLVNQGFNLFVVSWVNPTAQLENKNFTSYIQEGSVAALEVVKKITNRKKVNMAGWCVGGTLLASTACYLAAKGDKSIKSLTFLTTLMDFSQPGEMGLYLSDHLYPMVEQNAAQKGVLDGRILALGFSMLRENNLFWSFFINNYLKGKDPAPFDLLHWNSDSTNLTSSCFKQYMDNTYLSNNLINGEFEIDGIKLNLSNIDVPCYFLSTLADHIVLWQSSYQGVKQVSGDSRFVLSGSGHLAGVINPVDGGKYPHWINDELPDTPESWFEGASKNEGSWWTDWDKWLQPLSGKKTDPMIPGQHKDFPILESAPGSYVKVKI